MNKRERETQRERERERERGGEVGEAGLIGVEMGKFGRRWWLLDGFPLILPSV